MVDLEKLEPDRELAELLELYYRHDGAILFALFFCDPMVGFEYEWHREAAIRTVIGAYQDLYGRHDREQISGRKITLSEFLGPLFNEDRRQFALPGITESTSRYLFYVGDEEVLENRVDLSDYWDSDNYYYAFFAAPHNKFGEYFSSGNEEFPYPAPGTHNYSRKRDQQRKQNARKASNELFLNMNRRLFDDFTVPLEIYLWSTDWSDYFNDGREYWGTFLWTVHNPTQKMLIGIAASATD